MGWRFTGEARHEVNSSLKKRLRKMPVERVLAKIGKKHSVEAKMAQNENMGLTGVFGKI